MLGSFSGIAGGGNYSLCAGVIMGWRWRMSDLLVMVAFVLVILCFVCLLLLALGADASEPRTLVVSVRVVCSEPVVGVPRLKFRTASGEILSVTLAGEIPGATFEGEIEFTDLDEGVGEWFFPAGELKDRAGNVHEGGGVRRGRRFNPYVRPVADISARRERRGVKMHSGYMKSISPSNNQLHNVYRQQLWVKALEDSRGLMGAENGAKYADEVLAEFDKRFPVKDDE